MHLLCGLCTLGDAMPESWAGAFPERRAYSWIIRMNGSVPRWRAVRQAGRAISVCGSSADRKSQLVG